MDRKPDVPSRLGYGSIQPLSQSIDRKPDVPIRIGDGCPQTCHSSSGVEHPIRNRAVVSSILTCGSLTTIKDAAPIWRRFVYVIRATGTAPRTCIVTSR